MFRQNTASHDTSLYPLLHASHCAFTLVGKIDIPNANILMTDIAMIVFIELHSYHSLYSLALDSSLTVKPSLLHCSAYSVYTVLSVFRRTFPTDPTVGDGSDILNGSIILDRYSIVRIYLTF